MRWDLAWNEQRDIWIYFMAIVGILFHLVHLRSGRACSSSGIVGAVNELHKAATITGNKGHKPAERPESAKTKSVP
jgi:hypothetical protein